MKKYPFLFCGFTGLCLEILWTGLHSLLRGDASMKGTTSLLMFPIYGCASLILPVYKKLKTLPALLRGSLYTAGFYLAEFTSGSILQAFHAAGLFWSAACYTHQYKDHPSGLSPGLVSHWIVFRKNTLQNLLEKEIIPSSI